MPGSLFPRSPPPEEPHNQRHVRFASSVRSPLPRSRPSQVKRISASGPVESPYIDLTQNPDEDIEQSPSHDHENGSSDAHVSFRPLPRKMSISDTPAVTNNHPKTVLSPFSPRSSPSGRQSEMSSLGFDGHSVLRPNVKLVRDNTATADTSPSHKPLSWKTKGKWKADDQSSVHGKESSHLLSSYSEGTTLQPSSLTEKTRKENQHFDQQNIQEYVRKLEEKVKLLEHEVGIFFVKKFFF